MAAAEKAAREPNRPRALWSPVFGAAAVGVSPSGMVTGVLPVGTSPSGIETGVSPVGTFSSGTVTGASGDARKAVEKYLSGELHSTDAVCHEHQHHDTCKDE